MSKSTDLAARLQGYRLATAEVIYYLPDHPSLLQSFVWQTMDCAPQYPRIAKFLNFWRREIEAVIHSVHVGSTDIVAPSDWRSVDGEFRLN